MAGGVKKRSRSPFAVLRRVRQAWQLAMQLTEMTHGTTRRWAIDRLPATQFDYANRVGDKLGSSTVMGPVLWIARTFPEAPIGLRDIDSGELELRGPMQDLLRRPNPFYSGRLLWMASVISLMLGGNAYWAKIRDGMGMPVELWWIPNDLIEPKRPQNGQQFISHYSYKPRGEPHRLEIEDVVHLRWGIDPRNPIMGLSPIDSVLREVYTDDEAANFTAAMLRNNGVPGMIFSPDSEGVDLDQAELDETKQYIMDQLRGDKRGEPMVFGAPTKVQPYGFRPDQLDLGKLREIPEERVCAVLGIPAAVVGFGTGLQQTKVGATMREMREQAYESCIIPTQAMIGQDLDTQLKPDFVPDPDSAETVFDLQHVRVLQEDENAKAERWSKIVAGSLAQVAEARRQIGLETDASHEVYLVPEGTQVVRELEDATADAGELGQALEVAAQLAGERDRAKKRVANGSH